MGRKFRKLIQETFLNFADVDENILIGGDFNFCLDPVLDRTARGISRGKAAKPILVLMRDLNLIDERRRIHPRERDYPFYSNRHNSYSRIDLFLTSSRQQGRILDAEYKARILSDHLPLLMTIKMPDKEKPAYSWRLNPLLLKRSDFIREQIQLFCDTNFNSVNDKFVIWDALKAYLRGQIISFTSKIKKDYMNEVDRLEQKIMVLEKDLHKRSSEDKRRQLINKKLQYNTLQTYRTEKAITRTKQRYYELGERSIDWQLRAERVSRTINVIKNYLNVINYKPKKINESFKEFYSKLYSSVLTR